MKTSVKRFSGKRLKELIRANGLTQEQFAEEFGVSVQTVSYWIRGKKKPTSDNLKLLADYFNVPEVCLTRNFPLCTKEEYHQSTLKLIEILNPPSMALNILQNDNDFDLLYEYLLCIGEKYDTFNYDVIDKGFIDNKSVVRVIQERLEKIIEQYFVEFGIIELSEVEQNDEK